MRCGVAIASPIRKRARFPAVGNTVDLKTATYTNNIGAVELLGEWTDPWFDPNAYTTYYARVLEIPTPRWSTYWSAKLNLPPNPNVPAITSPSTSLRMRVLRRCQRRMRIQVADRREVPHTVVG